MPISGNEAQLNALKTFANALKSSYGSQVAAQQEDQLKGPTGNLLSAFGSEFAFNVIPRFEAPVPGVGRPDIALDVGGALCGYVELKAPQVSVRNLKGHDREQFNKFKTLPNLVYTNGNEWILYRDGERKQTVRLSGDVTDEGAGAVEERDAERLSAMLRDFLDWDPIVPSSPKALAELLAPLCHLLREDVTEALGNPESAISQLAGEWREYLFPEADNRRFADAYAQTLTYALLLARMEGEEDLSVSAGGPDATERPRATLAGSHAARGPAGADGARNRRRASGADDLRRGPGGPDPQGRGPLALLLRRLPRRIR